MSFEDDVNANTFMGYPVSGNGTYDPGDGLGPRSVPTDHPLAAFAHDSEKYKFTSSPVSGLNVEAHNKSRDAADAAYTTSGEAGKAAGSEDFGARLAGYRKTAATLGIPVDQVIRDSGNETDSRLYAQHKEVVTAGAEEKFHRWIADAGKNATDPGAAADFIRSLPENERPITASALMSTNKDFMWSAVQGGLSLDPRTGEIVDKGDPSPKTNQFAAPGEAGFDPTKFGGEAAGGAGGSSSGGSSSGGSRGGYFDPTIIEGLKAAGGKAIANGEGDFRRGAELFEEARDAQNRPIPKLDLTKAWAATDLQGEQATQLWGDYNNGTGPSGADAYLANATGAAREEALRAGLSAGGAASRAAALSQGGRLTQEARNQTAILKAQELQALRGDALGAAGTWRDSAANNSNMEWSSEFAGVQQNDAREQMLYGAAGNFRNLGYTGVGTGIDAFSAAGNQNLGWEGSSVDWANSDIAAKDAATRAGALDLERQKYRDSQGNDMDRWLSTGLTVGGGILGFVGTGFNPAGAMLGASAGGALGGAVTGSGGNPTSGMPDIAFDPDYYKKFSAGSGGSGAAPSGGGKSSGGSSGSGSGGGAF